MRADLVHPHEYIISNPVESVPQGEKRMASALLLEYDTIIYINSQHFFIKFVTNLMQSLYRHCIVKQQNCNFNAIIYTYHSIIQAIHNIAQKS